MFFLSAYVQKMRYVEMTGDFAVLQKCMNIVITGNPGTGKTFARLMFRFLRAHGILKRDAFVEKNALELKGLHRADGSKRDRRCGGRERGMLVSRRGIRSCRFRARHGRGR